MFRYPGGKKKLKKPICDKLESLLTEDSVYIEPFFGTGAICLELIKRNKLRNVALNDLDSSISLFWNAILQCPKEFCNEVEKIEPSVELFNQLKEKYKASGFNVSSYLSSNLNLEEIAAEKIALHQMSYSGLGAKAGGPIGGKLQKSNYQIDCRWSPNKIIKAAWYNHKLLNLVTIKYDMITNWRFDDVLDEVFFRPEKKYVLYLDPPYFDKGNSLYVKGFKEGDHISLCDKLNSFGGNVKWLLSYDNHPYIRKLYSKFNIEELQVSYTINGANKAKEILISNT